MNVVKVLNVRHSEAQIFIAMSHHLRIHTRAQLAELMAALAPGDDAFFVQGSCSAPMGSVLTSVARCNPLPAGCGPEAVDRCRALAKLGQSLSCLLGQQRPLIVRFEPPTPAATPSSTAPSTPGATPRGPSFAAAWTRYKDAAGRKWWSEVGEEQWFFEESVEWELYRCPVTGAVWKHNEATGAACYV